MRSTRAAALALSLAAAALHPSHVRAQAPPGAPQPSRGAPGPGTDPLGSSVGTVPAVPSPEERQAAAPEMVIESIEVQGNDRTPASTIRSRLAIRPGEVLTADALASSRTTLLESESFNHVELHVRPGSAPGLAVLVVDVDERGLVTLNNGTLAQTPVSRPYAGFEVAAPNLFGREFGASIGWAADLNGRHAVRATVYAPDVRLGGRAWVFGLRAIVLRGLESACGTTSCEGHFGAIPWVRYDRTGGELAGGFRPRPFSRFVAAWRFEQIRASTDPGAVPEARPNVREGLSHVSALVLSFDLDTRDDPLVPTTGWRVATTATIGTAAIGSTYEYTRWLVQAERWFGRPHGRALRLDAAAGLVQGDAPFFDRFYAADWSYFSVSLAAPRVLEVNFSPDSRYDSVLLAAGVEYDLSLWRARTRFFRRGVLAFGARGVLTTATPASAPSRISSIPISIDAAIRIQTKYGTFGIGLGYLVDQVIKALPFHLPSVQLR